MKNTQRITPARRLTAKQRVLQKFPDARECYTRSNNEKAIGIGLNTILGLGKTWRAAWSDAAKTAKNRRGL